MSARYGYGPNGRALKKDGTERKERTTKSVQDRFAEIEIAKSRVFALAGKAHLSETEGFEAFNSGLARFKARISEARRYSTRERRDILRARLEAEILAIDEKGLIAEEYLSGVEDSMNTISGIYEEVGKAVMEGGDTDISDMLSLEVTEIVEDSNNPETDPFAKFKSDNEDSEEDSDEL